MDFYDADISKKSPIGISSNLIRNLVLDIKKLGVKAEVAVVYDTNKDDITKLIEWGLNNNIVVKVIEKTYEMINYVPKDDFFELISELKEKFDLKCGITADLKEYYLTNGNTKVKFFQSHCNRKECDVCSRLHMRVTSDGNAEPCIWRKDTLFSLVEGDFEVSMCRAIANLGNGPQNRVI